MKQSEFDAAMRAQAPDHTASKLLAVFRKAFMTTQDIDSAMSAVNERLIHPMTYEQFAVLLHPQGR